MTVLQRAINDYFEIPARADIKREVAQTRPVTKKIVNIAKLALIMIGSMSLSFYAVFVA